MDLETVKDSLQWVAGILASAMFVWMSFLSMEEHLILSWQVSVAMISLIIILLYGASELGRIINSWERRRRRAWDTIEEGARKEREEEDK